MGQTVNLLAHAFASSNLARPTTKKALIIALFCLLAVLVAGRTFPTNADHARNKDLVGIVV